MMYAAIMGVSMRATTSEANTASAAVQPNCLKNLPAMPLMKAVGKNTAISVKVVAMTARPISSAASSAACRGVLPMRRWRSMFSTSTMASSTKMPITSDNASSVTTLMEKPSRYMPMKAGMADSGSATADTKVAGQSRRNSHTTMTASTAPSYSSTMEPSNSSCTGVTKSKDSVNCMSGWVWASSASAARTAAPTSTSLAPRLRATSNPTTGWPLSKAAARGSATVSRTVATWSRRMRRGATLGLPLPTDSSSAPSSAAEPTVARVRRGCSRPPSSARPPEASTCTSRSWLETSAAVTPSASRRLGSRATSTCRLTPPTRLTAPTPRTDSSFLVMVSSTNQLRPSASRLGTATV